MCASVVCASQIRMCEVCQVRPRAQKAGKIYPTCGFICDIAQVFTSSPTSKGNVPTRTPLLLEARPDQITDVERRFKSAWKGSGECPSIKKVYKIMMNKSSLRPAYDQYKKRVGNEVFRYHGTSRSCTLGSRGNTRPCSSTTCVLCSILQTSFEVKHAKPSGAFGAGVYTSSAANKAYSYSNDGRGAVILTKVVLGTVYNASAFNEVMSCPPGHNSVVFDRQNGTLNETVVYTNDAIRPVFLIMF